MDVQYTGCTTCRQPVYEATGTALRQEANGGACMSVCNTLTYYYQSSIRVFETLSMVDMRLIVYVLTIGLTAAFVCGCVPPPEEALVDRGYALETQDFYDAARVALRDVRI